MATVYILKSKPTNRTIRIEYEGGYLMAIKMLFKERLSEDKYRSTLALIPYCETDLPNLAAASNGIEIEKEQPREAKTTPEKIALFCLFYKKHTTVNYVATQAEPGMIRNVTIDEKLLDAYFTTDHFYIKNNYSITNYVRHFNLVQNYAYGNTKQRNKYPNTYKPEFTKTLSPNQFNAYCQHLINLGLKPQKTA